MKITIHKKIIIIGAGWAGIYALKHLLDEGISGKDIVTIEKTSGIGGVWRWKVLDFTHATSSVFYMHPSDHPFPENTPEFPHHSLVLDHLEDYCDHFDLKKLINFNEEVLSITDEKTYFSIDTTKQHYISEKIIICSGLNNFLPPIPKNLSKFSGQIIHSDHYSECESKLKNKSILIVGGGETASDIATELCHTRFRNKIYMSIRNGQWFEDRILGALEPADMLYNRFVDHFYPKWFLNNTAGRATEQLWGRRGSGIEWWDTPSGFLNSFYNKSRDVIQWIAQGKIIPCDEAFALGDDQIQCKTQPPTPFRVDTILLATGYKVQYPFLEFSLEILPKNRYKSIFDPNFRDRIAFIGTARPYVGSIPMLTEIQARYVAKVMLGKHDLPSESRMRSWIRKDIRRRKKEFPKDFSRLNNIVDPFTYLEDLATDINMYPNMKKYFFTNPKLFCNLMFDSWNIFAFRLEDPDPEKRKIAKQQINLYHNHRVSRKARLVSFQITASLVLSLVLLTLLLRLYLLASIV